MPRGVRRVVDVDVLRSADLQAAIVAAVEECGRVNGWADRYGSTPVSAWMEKVAEGGVFAPVGIAQWLRTDRKITWTVEPLVALAKIMAHYGVLIDGVPMPPDYFVRILASGKYDQADQISLARQSSPQWLKTEIKRMDAPDRADLMFWLARYTGREWGKTKQKAIAK